MVMPLFGLALGQYAIYQTKQDAIIQKAYDEAHYDPSNLVDSFTSLEGTLPRYGRYLQELNRGGMLSLQSVISDESTSCFTKTAATNVLINNMFDATLYTGGEITQGEFQAKFQIMGYALMD